VIILDYRGVIPLSHTATMACHVESLRGEIFLVGAIFSPKKGFPEVLINAAF
jgi:hypothetical protein